MGTAVSHFTIAGRDRLALTITRRNLLAAGVPDEQVTLCHVPTLLDVAGQFDWIVYFPDQDPGYPWYRQWPIIESQLLATDGRLLLVAKSAFVPRLLLDLGKKSLLKDKRRRGWRALLLRRAARK